MIFLINFLMILFVGGFGGVEKANAKNSSNGQKFAKALASQSTQKALAPVGLLFDESHFNFAIKDSEKWKATIHYKGPSFFVSRELLDAEDPVKLQLSIYNNTASTVSANLDAVPKNFSVDELTQSPIFIAPNSDHKIAVYLRTDEIGQFEEELKIKVNGSVKVLKISGEVGE